MKTNFGNFKLATKKRSGRSVIDGDVRITTNYFSFTPKALKKLDTNEKGYVLIATIDEADMQRIIVAGSDHPNAIPLKKTPSRGSNITADMIVIKEKDRSVNAANIRGDYHLNYYGQHEGHQWYILLKRQEMPKFKALR